MKLNRATKFTILERFLDNRWPVVGKWIRREAAVALLEDGSPEAVKVLTHALVSNDDPVVCDVIWANIEQLTNRNHPGGLQPPQRSKILTDWALSERRGWVRLPSPDELARTALKTGDLDKFKSSGASWIKPLLAACDDPDRKVRANLEKVLRDLEDSESHEALCRELIEKDIPLARAIVIEKGIAPEDRAARALFFFLTGQWDRYESLDFDRRLLCVAYAAEDTDVRRRIRERLRVIGHPELLSVVTGHDAASRVVEMSPDELEFVVGMLQSSRDWSRLWGMIFEISLLWSVRILTILANAGWQPPEAERGLFVELQALLEAGLLLDSEAFVQEFPRVLLQAQLHAPGRINDLTFAPHRPLLGIGTGSRKVLLWNYRTAQCEQEVDGFRHSVGRVAFTGDGCLVCAERPHQAKAPAGIHSWDGQRLRRLGEHQGPVTALEPVPDSKVLSAGRDGDIKLWEVATGRQLLRHTLSDWPRAVRVAPSGDSFMVLIHQEVQWLDLTGMRMMSHARSSVTPTCAAFLPATSPMPLIGRRDGSVTLYRQGTPWLHKERTLCTHALAVQGIEVLPERGYILTAGNEGEVRFFVEFEQVDWVAASGRGLTALHVSPDEAFMAIGHADGSFSLWDLRGPEVAALLSTPLASISSPGLRLLDAFASNLKLKEVVRRTLICMSLIVRHRIRFDIELESVAPSILAGDFDIELG
ncbi:MAG: hypothetical protein JXA21_17020 [Anaerolineae bacterium]|nr:hypothetical protein [Anaerolineae bacterium]